MKSFSKRSLNKREKLSAAEIKKAFTWIDNLPEKEIAKLNRFVKVEVAQIVHKAYLKRTGKQSKKKMRGGDN